MGLTGLFYDAMLKFLDVGSKHVCYTFAVNLLSHAVTVKGQSTEVK